MWRVFLTVAVSLACVWTLRAEVVVRVQETAGGPQIHVDGVAVAPRFFMGVEVSGRLRVTPEWRTYTFDVVPDEDVPGKGTFHIRFALAPVGERDVTLDAYEVWLTDFQFGDVIAPGSLADEAAHRKMWNVWPPAEKNSVAKLGFEDGCAKLLLNDPPAGQVWPDYHFHTPATLTLVKGQTYRCTFRARGTPGVLLDLSCFNLATGKWRFLGGMPGPFLPQVALARDAGVRLVSFDAPMLWGPPEEVTDWRALDARCRRIIEVNPGALLVPRVSADAPGWWLERHSDARMVYADGVDVKYASVSDRRYRRDACEYLGRVARHLCEAFPEHFAGIHPSGQNTGEWFYLDGWSRINGYDPATLEAFRAWLKARGVGDADDAVVPSPEERRERPGGALRDPGVEGRVLEFALFQQEEMAGFVAEMARACREATGGKKLVVFFYGYGFEFAAVPGGAAQSGHYALASLLRSRDIDILCSPNSYTDRTWLGSVPVMSAAESVMRAGILWLNEDDSRTHLDPRKQELTQEGTLVNLRQTQDIMLRNTAQSSLRGFGSWWMDLPGQGWFNDAEIWRELKRLRPVDEAMLKRASPFAPEIAAIIDETSMCCLTRGTVLVHQRGIFGRCGAPYGQYLLQDVLDKPLSARMKVFLSAWHLTQEQREALSRESGGMRVWCWAPGYIFPERRDVDGIRQVTGFKALPVALDTAVVTPTRVGRMQGLTEAWGERTAIRPLFSVEASEREVWATYADGSAAVAVRQSARGIDVFVGTPALTPELLHALAKLAGVHLYAKPGTVLWAANGYLATQAQEEGEVAFDMGQGKMIKVPMVQGEVRIFKAD